MQTYYLVSRTGPSSGLDWLQQLLMTLAPTYGCTDSKRADIITLVMHSSYIAPSGLFKELPAVAGAGPDQLRC